MLMSGKHPDAPSVALPGGIAIESTNLSYQYVAGQTAVDDVAVPFYAGDVTMIVGPNGSGKSTLLQLLLGHLTPSAGTITVHGQNITGLHPLNRAALLSYVPQTPQVSFAYSVQEIVAMGYWAHRRRALRASVPAGDQSAMDRIVQTMWDLDIHALAQRTFDELSAGERQRVAIARALVQDTPIILLDEPTAALDVWHQLELLDHLKSLARDRQKAIIWVTHDLNHARANADRVLIMHEGKLAAHGNPKHVLTSDILEPIYRVHVTLRDDNLLFSRHLACGQ